MTLMFRLLLAAAFATQIACAGETTPPQGEGQTAPGAAQSMKTSALETGADLLQNTRPVSRISMHLVGFHPSKADPAMQMESHHFCTQVNQDFAQCVLYDGDTEEARLHGVEFIISESLYETLPDEERAYWHPHNYEILSGTLRMPNLPSGPEKAALADKMNSYGKTWHVWKTGVHGQPPDALPLGPAELAWSFNYDGEIREGLVEARDRRMDLDTAAARRDRADLAARAKPQAGVDAMKGKFPNASGTAPGVADNGDTRSRPVPKITLQP